MAAEKEKKPNIFVRIGRWFKATALELKKVTWPKFGEVMKKFGIVLGVVMFFFVVLLVMDVVLGIGYGALVGRYNWWQFWSLGG